MKLLKISIISVAMASLSAVPAFAHTGSHEASFLVNLMHWLTSPTHALLAVVGSAAIVALIVKLKRA
ncbi:MAG: hypothetical protein COB92_07585 [Robiginitomaculum sp.]|nr:MAG: hypothetical protein COB92_07585 [Robiginitomaculum sp.]